MKRVLSIGLIMALLLALPGMANLVPRDAIAISASKGTFYAVVHDEHLLALPEAELYQTLQLIIERAGLHAESQV